MSTVQSREECAFWLYSAMFTTYGLRDMYEPGLKQLKLCCYQFQRLLSAFLPHLFEHMVGEGIVVEMFVIGWFQTLFLYVDALPPATRDRIWDIFFFERSWKIFFRVGIAIMELAMPALLKVRTAPSPPTPASLLFVSHSLPRPWLRRPLDLTRVPVCACMPSTAEDGRAHAVPDRVPAA